VQNVAKCNKIAITGLKNVFLFIKTGFSFVLNGTVERVKALKKRVETQS
jgi:hypothetical protein